MVSSVDDGVGRVMESLRRHQIEEDTIVFFLSDNGGPITKNASNNDPLRGAKSDLFEGGIRVPFAMQWKGTIPGGQVYREPIISLDIFATIAEQTGVMISSERPLDGVNLVPYLTGKKQGVPHDILYWRKFEQNGMAIREGNTKLVANTQRQKNNFECYDLRADISESNNLRENQPAKNKTLITKWEAWNTQMKERAFPSLMEDIWWER